VDLVEERRHLLDFIDDNGAREFAWRCGQHLFPKQRGTLDQLKTKVGLQQVEAQTVWKRHAEIKRPASLPRSPEEGRLPGRKVEAKPAAEDRTQGVTSFLVQLKWNILHFSIDVKGRLPGDHLFFAALRWFSVSM
jgi:hypothetical protein